jgi:hypothetical protein
MKNGHPIKENDHVPPMAVYRRYGGNRDVGYC